MRLQYVDGHGDTALVEGRWTAFRKAGRVIDQTFGQVCPGVPTVDTYTVDTSDLGAKTAGSTDDTDGTIGGSEP